MKGTTNNSYRTEVVIAGAGLAGIVTACELLDHGKQVLLIDKDIQENFGGLARRPGTCSPALARIMAQPSKRTPERSPSVW